MEHICLSKPGSSSVNHSGGSIGYLSDFALSNFVYNITSLGGAPKRIGDFVREKFGEKLGNIVEFTGQFGPVTAYLITDLVIALSCIITAPVLVGLICWADER